MASKELDDIRSDTSFPGPDHQVSDGVQRATDIESLLTLLSTGKFGLYVMVSWSRVSSIGKKRSTRRFHFEKPVDKPYILPEVGIRCALSGILCYWAVVYHMESGAQYVLRRRLAIEGACKRYLYRLFV